VAMAVAVVGCHASDGSQYKWRSGIILTRALAEAKNPLRGRDHFQEIGVKERKTLAKANSM